MLQARRIRIFGEITTNWISEKDQKSLLVALFARKRLMIALGFLMLETQSQSNRFGTKRKRHKRR